MIPVIAVTFIDLFVLAFNILIIARVMVSWIVPHPDANQFAKLVFDLTEPVLGPIRKLLPKSQLIDLSPLVAFIILQILAYSAPRLLLGL